MLEVKVRANPYAAIRKGHYRPRPKPKAKAFVSPPLPPPPEPPRYDGLYVGPRGKSVYFFRAEADALCSDCLCAYSGHSKDRHERDMTVLCNGWRVKLPAKSPPA